MAGQWGGGLSLAGWSVSPANGPRGGRRWKIRAPNKRRWECDSRDRHGLHLVVRALHDHGLCAPESPLDLPIPPGILPADIREVPQLRCRDCKCVRPLEDFSDGSRSCRPCVRRRCRGAKAKSACPVCDEIYPNESFVEVDDLGLACSLCVSEFCSMTEPEEESLAIRSVIEDCVPRLRLRERNDMKKSAIALRAGGFGWVWPEAVPPINDKCTQGCLIVGLDTEDGPDHKYFDRRGLAEPTEAQIRAMMHARPQDIPPLELVRVPGGYSAFWVKMGRTRVRTMREVNKRLIAMGEPPRKLMMRVNTSNDDKSAALAIAQENLCRKKTTPLDELAYIEDQLARGSTTEEVAEMFAKSTDWVRQRLALQGIHPDLAKAIDDGKMPLVGALKIASKPYEKQAGIVEAALAKAEGKGLSSVPVADVAEAAGAKWRRPNVTKLRKLRASGKLHPKVVEFLEWFDTGEGPETVHGLADALKALEQTGS